jgi:hypothetical protein
MCVYVCVCVCVDVCARVCVCVSTRVCIRVCDAIGSFTWPETGVLLAMRGLCALWWSNGVKVVCGCPMAYVVYGGPMA